jgi:hypothetical protein
MHTFHEQEDFSGNERPAALPRRQRPALAVNQQRIGSNVLIDDDDAGIGADKIIGDCRDALHDRHRHREITAVGGKPCGRFRKMRQHQIAASEMIGSDEPVEAQRRAGTGIMRLGLGVNPMPRFRAEGDLEKGTLVAVLPEFPPPPSPISLLYPQNRQLSPRDRVFMDWAAGEYAKRNDQLFG